MFTHWPQLQNLVYQRSPAGGCRCAHRICRCCCGLCRLTLSVDPRVCVWLRARMGNEASGPSATSAPPVESLANLPTRVCKVLVVGGAGTGKTSLVRRFLHNVPPDADYKPSTQLDFSLLSVLIAGGGSGEPLQALQLHLWDVPAAEEKTGRTPIFYSHLSCVFIVADATRTASFEEAARWKKDIDNRSITAPCALLVNKVDLNRVPLPALDSFAKQHGFRSWHMTSAAELNTGLAEAVRFVVASAKA